MYSKVSDAIWRESVVSKSLQLGLQWEAITSDLKVSAPTTDRRLVRIYFILSQLIIPMAFKINVMVYGDAQTSSTQFMETLIESGYTLSKALTR
jgi:hypothetical protein